MICPNCGQVNLPGSDACERCQLDLAPLDQPAGQDRVEATLIETCIADLPLKPTVTVTRQASVHEAIQRMVSAGIGAVVVVDEAGQIAGIFTERDLLKRVAGQRDDLTAIRIDEVMTPHPETVTPEHSLAFVLHKMDVGGYRHLPVVQDGRPISVVSIRGMIRHVTGLCIDV